MTTKTTYTTVSARLDRCVIRRSVFCWANAGSITDWRLCRIREDSMMRQSVPSYHEQALLDGRLEGIS